MRKRVLIGVIVVVLALGTMGAAFATGLSSVSGINVLSRGNVNVPSIGVDYMGYVISSGCNQPAALVGVTLSFTADVPAGSVIFLSVRNDSTPASEVAYYAGVTGALLGMNANHTFYLYDMSNHQYTGPGDTNTSGFPDVSTVTKICVTVAGGSNYNTP
jgi:hypothetical protein